MILTGKELLLLCTGSALELMRIYYNQALVPLCPNHLEPMMLKQLTFCVLRLTWPGTSILWYGLDASVWNPHGQSWFNSSWSYQTSAERFLLKAKLKVWSVCSGVYIHLFICS